MLDLAVLTAMCRAGVPDRHTRPVAVENLASDHTSNDNPFSEAQFKTLKYRPDLPERFVHEPPRPPQLADTIWINRPVDDPATGTLQSAQ